MIIEVDKRLIAWCLALEGSIMLIKNRGAYTPCVEFINTNPELITKFSKLIIDIPHHINRKDYNDKRSTNYRCRCRTLESAKCILDTVKDYLPSKNKQAELLLEFINSRLDNKFSITTEREREIHNEIKELNKLGKGKREG